MDRASASGDAAPLKNREPRSVLSVCNTSRDSTASSRNRRYLTLFVRLVRSCCCLQGALKPSLCIVTMYQMRLISMYCVRVVRRIGQAPRSSSSSTIERGLRHGYKTSGTVVRWHHPELPNALGRDSDPLAEQHPSHRATRSIPALSAPSAARSRHCSPKVTAAIVQK